MNVPFSVNRRQLLASAGFLALSFAIPLDDAAAAESSPARWKSARASRP